MHVITQLEWYNSRSRLFWDLLRLYHAIIKSTTVYMFIQSKTIPEKLLVTICITLRKIYHFLGNFSSKFPRVIQRYSKFANFTGLYFPYFTIFRHQTFHSTSFKILFLAVVKDFVLSAWFVYFANIEMSLLLHRKTVIKLKLNPTCSNLFRK